jgi:hypothetical protein
MKFGTLLASMIFAMTIWGNVQEYTNTYIMVDDVKYEYTHEVIIDTYSLEKNIKGNVRVELNDDGMAEEIYFYGISMPDVIRKFKR